MPASASAPRSIDTPLPPSEGTRRRTAEELGDYLTELGGQLARYGCPAYRIESLIETVATLEGHRAEAFALPTALFVTVVPQGAPLSPVHRMVRLRSWSIDLDRLLLVDRVFNEVAEDRRTIDAARAELADLERRPAAYGRLSTWLAMAAISAAAAVFFRGGALEIALAGLLGLGVHALGRVLGRVENGRFLHDFAGALLCSLGAAALGATFPDASREVVILAGMIILFPGMTFTTGLAELAQKNLVAGGGRLMEALVTFLALVFGVALSVGIAGALDLPIAAPPPREALGWPAQLGAVIGVAVGFGVAFQVPRALLWTAVASCGVSYGAMALGQRHLPGHIAAFLAATLVCAVANALARATHRPAQLYHLPGMMLLVPGSLGFAGFEGLLRGSYLTGAEKLVQMLLVAGGLVMGVLVANVIVRPKKLL